MSELQKSYADFVLPPSVVSKIDVSRLVSEVERLDGELTTMAVRASVGSQVVAQPVISRQLADFLQANSLTISQNNQERTELLRQLRHLKDKIPVVHMTFAVTADAESLARLAAWLRSEVHSQAVISVGLQPALVAGVYLRTPNQVHDLSLRAKLKGSHALLIKELEAARG